MEFLCHLVANHSGSGWNTIIESGFKSILAWERRIEVEEEGGEGEEECWESGGRGREEGG